MTLRSLLRGTAFWFGFIVLLFWVQGVDMTLESFWRGWLIAFGLAFLQGLYMETFK